ncbi:MAG: alpha/beta hydrolase, partial [Gammaproteobacteria bacterium]|nr:alpha/beta hydrolase [Gammaproteobacteria bacterium]
MRAKLPHTEGKIDRDGINIHYEVYGEGDHTIVFIPTWSLVHSRAYKAQIPYFSSHFRCVTFDPRGNGKSDRPTAPDAHRLIDYVEDSLAVMDETGTSKAIVFGLSASTLTAAALAAYHPDRIEAVILIGTNTPLAETYEYKMYGQYDLDLDLDSHEGWQKFNRGYWRKNYPDFVDFFSRQIFNDPHSTKQIEDAINWGHETNEEVLIATMDTADPDDLVLDEAAYRRISCPTLVIHGEDDVVAPIEGGRVVSELTGGELVVIPRAGHGPQGRIPAKVNTLMRDFLARHLGTWKPTMKAHKGTAKKALYLSSPIGLGHGRRDLAIAHELRKLHPDLQVD